MNDRPIINQLPYNPPIRNCFYPKATSILIKYIYLYKFIDSVGNEQETVMEILWYTFITGDNIYMKWIPIDEEPWQDHMTMGARVPVGIVPNKAIETATYKSSNSELFDRPCPAWILICQGAFSVVKRWRRWHVGPVSLTMGVVPRCRIMERQRSRSMRGSQCVRLTTRKMDTARRKQV